MGKLEKNNLVTEEYFFKSEKENFKREIQFLYSDGLIEEVNIEPNYDTSKITNVSDIMIQESIDPVSMFYLITDFEFIKNCNKTIKYTMVSVDMILFYQSQLKMIADIVVHLHIKK